MKAMKSFLFLLSFLIPALISGQQSFQRSIGGAGNDFGRAIVVCSDGGYMIAGGTNSFLNPSADVYVLRIDDFGDYVWGRNFGSENHIEWAVDLVEDSDGNYLLVGYTDNTDGNGYDGLLMKVDGDGNHIWTMTFGSTDWDFFEAIALDELGNIYLGGSTYGENGRNAWLLKLDHEGNLIWEDTLTGLPLGGIADIYRCDDGNFVFTGNTEDPLTGVKRLIGGRFDRDGQFFWSAEFDGFGNAEGNSCTCTDGELKLIGNSYNATGETSDILIAGIDLLDGSELWTEIILVNNNDIGTGIGFKTNGNLVVSGTIFGLGFGMMEAYASELGPEGDFLGSGFGFTRGGDQDDWLNDIKATSDGGHISVGESNSFGNNYQVYIIKADADNNTPLVNIDFLDLATDTDPVMEISTLSIYPNPASNFIHINTSLVQEGYVRILDNAGKNVFESTFSGPDKIELPHLQAGVYIAEVTFGIDTYREKLVVIPY
jgi:hypothetical protein